MEAVTVYTQRRRWARLSVGFCALALLLWLRRGYPFSWQVAIAWCLVALVLLQPRVRLIRIALDWLPLLALLTLYQLARGMADELGRPIHARFPIELEERLFGTVLVERLQRAMLDPEHIAWWEVVPSLV